MFWICFCELSIGIVCVFFMGIRFALCCVGAEDLYPNETKRAELSVQLGLTYRRHGALWPPPREQAASAVGRAGRRRTGAGCG